jgi:hypothetical protein
MIAGRRRREGYAVAELALSVPGSAELQLGFVGFHSRAFPSIRG